MKDVRICHPNTDYFELKALENIRCSRDALISLICLKTAPPKDLGVVINPLLGVSSAGKDGLSSQEMRLEAGTTPRHTLSGTVDLSFSLLRAPSALLKNICCPPRDPHPLSFPYEDGI